MRVHWQTLAEPSAVTLSPEPLRHGFNTVRDSPETPDWVEVARGPRERPATNENRAVRFGRAWTTLSVLRTDLKRLCEWLENAPRRPENMVSKGVLNLPAHERVTEASWKMFPVPRERTEAIVPERRFTHRGNLTRQRPRHLKPWQSPRDSNQNYACICHQAQTGDELLCTTP